MSVQHSGQTSDRKHSAEPFRITTSSTCISSSTHTSPHERATIRIYYFKRLFSEYPITFSVSVVYWRRTVCSSFFLFFQTFETNVFQFRRRESQPSLFYVLAIALSTVTSFFFFSLPDVTGLRQFYWWQQGKKAIVPFCGRLEGTLLYYAS